MRTKRRWAGRVAAGLGVVVVLGVLSTLRDAGAFRTLAPHDFDRCQRLEATGSEDAVFDATTGLVLFTSQDFRALAPPKPGAIWAVAADGASAPFRLPNDLAGPFHPHGLGLFRAPDGERRLFVVNHVDRASSRVDVFALVDGPALRHLRTIEAPEFISLNDVEPVGPEQFYASLDMGTRADTAARVAETFLRLPWAGVVYFDGAAARVVASGLRYSNGVAMSADAGVVFVSESTGRRLLAYRRDAATGALTLEAEHGCETALDNVSVAPDGALWVGAHPKMLAFLAHASDATKRSPSQVLRATYDAASRSFTVREVALDDGAALSGSSVALPLPTGSVFVGSVFEHALLCVFPGK